MATRMISRTVVFRHPFVLGGFERVEPAGTYQVETEEEEIDGATVAVSAWRRMVTVMHIHHAGMTEYVKIDPADLDKALARDAGAQEAPSALTARLDAERTKNNARVARRKKF
ncbi:MAG: hypothetical protein JO167_02795 [Alphaproteobacteria bacterium]|nr:hypothetical protein [Alphaproteobacteria bacterium]